MEDQVESTMVSKAKSYWAATVSNTLYRLSHLSPLDGSEALVAARRTIDAESEAVAQLLCDIRARRNLLSLSVLLPPEVLARVLEFHTINCPFAPEDYTEDSGRNGRLRFLGWISATHVCRYWRHVALGHHVLWSKISLSHGPVWNDLMVARAHDVPLSIDAISFDGRHYPDPESRTEAIQQITCNHLPHIRELCLKVVNPDDHDELYNNSAPILEKLKLSLHVYSNARFAILPLNLFANTMPRLHHITMRDYVFPWDSFPKGRLSHLELCSTHSSKEAVFIPSFEQLMDLLGQSPTLQELRLMHCLPRRHQIPNLDSPTVHLPNLRTLALAGSCPDVTHILERITVPLAAQLDLTCGFDSRPGETQADPFFSWIAEHYNSDSAQPVELRTVLLRTYVDGETPFSLTAWRSLLPVGEPCDIRICEQPDIVVQFQWLWENEELLFIPGMQSMCMKLPLSHVERLSVDNEFWDPETWCPIFERLDRVRHFYLSSGDPAWVSVLLRSKVPPAAGSLSSSGVVAEPTLLLTHLSVLFLRGIEFDLTGMHATWVECLRFRAASGFPLQCLCIIASSDVADTERQEFEAIFPTVLLDEDSATPRDEEF
ncbi:hypothetical protein BV25DRAFT_1917919 [Artomyces pyxidatus]|uniref:Uncharacterized protein n=1 Tax=Artomyces pyxidatus TaxID=48021 RepID=A0ACB8SWL7_9AGAM|nr:hypothetical protein BV25DRAFT_1917919 [Artomyces pyxidatus]